MLRGLDRELGDVVQAVPPGGGMFRWVRFTDGTCTGELPRHAVAESEAFSITGGQDDGARLCFASVPEAQLDLGLEGSREREGGRHPYPSPVRLPDRVEFGRACG